VMVGSAELYEMVEKLVDEDNKLELAEKNYTDTFLSEVCLCFN